MTLILLKMRDVVCGESFLLKASFFLFIFPRQAAAS